MEVSLVGDVVVAFVAVSCSPSSPSKPCTNMTATGCCKQRHGLQNANIAFSLFFHPLKQTHSGGHRPRISVLSVRRLGRGRVHRTPRLVERLCAGGVQPRQRRRGDRGSRIRVEGLRRGCRRAFFFLPHRGRRYGGIGLCWRCRVGDLPGGHAGEFHRVRRLGSEYRCLGCACAGGRGGERAWWKSTSYWLTGLRCRYQVLEESYPARRAL